MSTAPKNSDDMQRVYQQTPAPAWAEAGYSAASDFVRDVDTAAYEKSNSINELCRPKGFQNDEKMMIKN